MAISTGINVGYSAARRVFEDPSLAHQEGLYFNQYGMYTLLWAYYNGAMFERIASVFNGNLNTSWQISANGWAIYKQNYNLYRNIRLIYNPTRRLVDFYAGQVYPGVLSEDGHSLPDGVALAVPFSDDTPAPLKKAIAQFWQWSNWQSRKSIQVRYGAALGSVLIELIDDIESGQISADIVWPGFVSHIQLDPAGNVKAYALEYQARDEVAAYIYRKEVDANEFRYYKDGSPFNYGDGGSVVPNPYGFVPAVWIKHTDIGGIHGSPAIAGSLGKIDELNNLASHVHDQIHKVIGAPLLIATNSSVTNLYNTQKRGATTDLPQPSGDQESILMLKADPQTHIESLAGNLNLADAVQYMNMLLSELEQDHPELTFYKELRAMSQVTGPAASRLVGDVQSRFAEASAAYDQGNIKLFQMAVAIAGFRANSGAWGPLNSQQQKFTPFNLDSYHKGDLDMAIMPRPLLVPTRYEIGTENEQMWRGVAFASQAGVPPEFVLQVAGWTDDKIATFKAAQAQRTQQQQLQAQADVIPTVHQ
jgi:hypothetical protein